MDTIRLSAISFGLMWVFFILLLNPVKAANYGQFENALELSPTEIPRNFRVTKEFTYIDPNNKRWTVPAETVVNGASIPRIFWSIIGGPYSGSYVKASTVHDHFCESMTRPWREVHRTFYTAMLLEGVAPIKAKIMYGAVYFFGPRWKRAFGVGGIETTGWIPEYDGKSFEELSIWIEKNNPTLKQIEDRIK